MDIKKFEEIMEGMVNRHIRNEELKKEYAECYLRLIEIDLELKEYEEEYLDEGMKEAGW
jgi:hypothetical protein